jgi:diacylglycerol kinase family enzyme
VLNEFRRFHEFSATVTVDGKGIRRKAFVIAVANSSQYGNNARIAPAASVRDEQLDISILRKISPFRLDLIYSFFRGTIDQSGCCETHRLRDTVIQLEAPMDFHIDGEYAGKSDRFVIALQPASLNVLAPCNVSKF